MAANKRVQEGVKVVKGAGVAAGGALQEGYAYVEGQVRMAEKDPRTGAVVSTVSGALGAVGDGATNFVQNVESRVSLDEPDAPKKDLPKAPE